MLDKSSLSWCKKAPDRLRGLAAFVYVCETCNKFGFQISQSLSSPSASQLQKGGCKLQQFALGSTGTITTETFLNKNKEFGDFVGSQT